jgi:hypothetical protein
MAHVYKLVWPGKEGVYVGCSTQIENREYHHRTTPKTRVLFLMQELYGEPELEVLEEVLDTTQMALREAYWIVELDALDGDKGGLNATENAQCAYWAGTLGLETWFEDKRERQESRKRLEARLSERLGELLGPHKDRVAGFWKDAKALDRALGKRMEERLEQERLERERPLLEAAIRFKLAQIKATEEHKAGRIKRLRARAEELIYGTTVVPSIRSLLEAEVEASDQQERLARKRAIAERLMRGS